MYALKLKSIMTAAMSAASILASQMVFAGQANAAGDLLVAPTRIVLDGRRGTEVILNNVGAEEATYRISLELRRMNSQGRLDDVDATAANEIEQKAIAMVRFAPKRVTLPPNQPQSIRIAIQQPEGLPDGEYRAHMMFRAIPKVQAATAAPSKDSGVQIQLIPIYGVTIPIIIRKGKLQAVAALSDPRLGKEQDVPMLIFDLSQTGNRSIFGDVKVSKSGVAAPIFQAKGIAIYPETAKRVVSIPLPDEAAAQLHGPLTIGYYEAAEAGGGLIAEVKSVLP